MSHQNSRTIVKSPSIDRSQSRSKLTSLNVIPFNAIITDYFLWQTPYAGVSRIYEEDEVYGYRNEKSSDR